MRKFLYIIGFWSRQQWMPDELHLAGSAAQQLSQLIYNANQILHIFKGERRERRLYTRFIIWKVIFFRAVKMTAWSSASMAILATLAIASQSNSNSSSISLASLSFPSPLSRHILARLTTDPQKDGMPGKSPRSAGCHSGLLWVPTGLNNYLRLNTMLSVFIINNWCVKKVIYQ